MRIQLGVAFAIGGRITTAAANLLIVPILTGFLGKEGFGLSVAITSTLAWINLGNFGLTQGAQMTLAKAFSEDTESRQRELVSSAFGVMTLAGLLTTLIFLSIYSMVPWPRVFPSASPQFMAQTAPTVLISFLNIAFLIPVSVVPALMNARQQTHLTAGFYTCMTLGTLAGAWAGTLLNKGLVGVAMGQSIGNVIVAYLFTFFYLAPSKHRVLRPGVRFVRWSTMGLLLHRSVPFALVQLCMILMMQSDNFIILHFLSAEEVTPYNIGHRFFTLIYAAFGVLIQPLWAAYTNAQVAGDFDWIRRMHGRLIRLFFAMTPIAAIGVFLFSRALMVWWVGIDIAPDPVLTWLIALLYLMRLWADIHGVLINALSQTRRLLVNVFLHPVLTLGSYALLIQIWGTKGMALGAVLGYLGIIAWYAPLLVHRILKEEPAAI